MTILKKPPQSRDAHAATASHGFGHDNQAVRYTEAWEHRKSRSIVRDRTPRFVIGTREGHHHMHTTFAIESNDSPAPGVIPEPVRVHDGPAATTVASWRAAGRAAAFSWPGHPVGNAPIKLEVQ
jgi:hypothetical protein